MGLWGPQHAPYGGEKNLIPLILEGSLSLASLKRATSTLSVKLAVIILMPYKALEGPGCVLPWRWRAFPGIHSFKLIAGELQLKQNS